MGPKPAERRIVGQLPGHATEVRHEFFNRRANEWPCQQLDRFTNQAIAFAEGEYDSGTLKTAVSGQQSYREAIFRIRMNGVCPGAWRQGKTCITCRD